MNIKIKFLLDLNTISKYYKRLLRETKNDRYVGNINEWLIDNYHLIIEEKHVAANMDMSKFKNIKLKQKKELYHLVKNILKDQGYSLSTSGLIKALKKYQKKNNHYLLYSEIDYIHILTRTLLASELATLTNRLSGRLTQKINVDQSFNQITEKIEKKENFNIHKYVKFNKKELNVYYIELINYKLKTNSIISNIISTNIETYLERFNTDLKEVVKKSHFDLTKDNVLIGNIFNSFKKVSKYEQQFLYKKISYVEDALNNEKAGIYSKMDNVSQNRYRNIIAKKAKRQKIDEYEYVEKILEQAEDKHIGFLLIEDKNYNLRAFIYAGVIKLLIFFSGLFVSYKLGFPMIAFIFVLLSVIIIEVINQFFLLTVAPKSILRLKMAKGIDSENKAMVVIPTILKNKKTVIEMFEKLEIYYLSNNTENLYFTLLGDCFSSDKKYEEKDKEIVRAGLEKSRELNKKYGSEIFYFIYRNRFYSAGEECYLGMERKRGALIHFNKLLLNKLTEKEKEAYFKIHTFNNFNLDIKYVLPLDRDTKLVLSAARVLVGSMAHPLNKPILNKEKTRVEKGYAIMQPRVNVDVETTDKSVYSQLFAGLGGLDVYVRAAFNIYQDVFNEASFVGKGIYDLKMFDKLLADTFPDNLILSHDMIEGSYLRCGFVDNIELFDDYPVSYLKDSARHHRWNRGDWQIISWITNRVKNKKGQKVKNPISFLSKIKIFDNLRRSLVSFSAVAVLLYGFSLGEKSPLYYLGLVVLVVSIPVLFFIFSKLLYRTKKDRKLIYYLDLVRGLKSVVYKTFIIFAILPYEAYLYFDSTMKALYRMLISKKRLLNWATSDEVEKMIKDDIKVYLKSFIINYVVAILLGALTYIYKPEFRIIAFMVGFVWTIAPVYMYLISKSINVKFLTLNKNEKDDLKEIAQRTFNYFYDLIREENNYLIPDNYQINREDKVDNRTSPTNIGYSIVALVSGAELGFIKPKDAINMIGNIIKTVEIMPKWNGHLFNWYDIKKLTRLNPAFISSVDNGNFVACLYVAKGFLEEYNDTNVLSRIVRLIASKDFSKLYNEDLDVFSIGYNYSDQTLIPYHYNNFASESRLTSYIAIAKNDIPYKHWFCLDKALTKYKHHKGVASWSGTTFEYFMPLIFLKTFNHTLMDESYYFAFNAQKDYVNKKNPLLPWGISESAFDSIDDMGSYRYHAFGVPSLTLRDTELDRLVISPYSSIMAIDIDDQEVYENIKKMRNYKLYDKYGFFEAYDDTSKEIITSYYAHHQGMILASLTNYLKDGIIRKYFNYDQHIKANEMLLKEKVQLDIYIDQKTFKAKKYSYSKEKVDNDIREYKELGQLSEMGVLSNSEFTLVLDQKGNSFVKHNDIYLNRYRTVPSNDYGNYIFIRNNETNKMWSNTYAPLNEKNDTEKVVFASDEIKYIKEVEGIVTKTEVTVTKSDSACIYKLTLRNNTDSKVKLEITTYNEIMLSLIEEDLAHRTFNSINIQSEYDEESESLIFSKSTKHENSDKNFVIGKLFDSDKSFTNFETIRSNFLDKNTSINSVDISNVNMTDAQGAVLDPIMAMRTSIELKPNKEKELYLIIGFGKSREQVRDIINDYSTSNLIRTAFNEMSVYNRIQDEYMNRNASLKKLYNRMLKYLYSNNFTNAKRDNLLFENNYDMDVLWKYSLSGKNKIITIYADKIEDASFVYDIIKCYEFYKSQNLNIDFVIITGEDLLVDYINEVKRYIPENGSGGHIYIIGKSDITYEEMRTFNIVSSLVFDTEAGDTLAESLDKLDVSPLNVTVRNSYETIKLVDSKITNELTFENKYGGFINDGTEYLIKTNKTPAPWSNVITNGDFGFIITNNFGGFTYYKNSREFKLTEWSGDISTDPISERIIINDKIFIPSVTIHGFGYSKFISETNEYKIEIKVFVTNDHPIKVYDINIENKLKKATRLNIRFEADFVLGVSGEDTNRYLYRSFNNNVLYVENKFTLHFKGIKAFMSSDRKINSYNGNSISVNLSVKDKDNFAFMIGANNNEELNIAEEFDKAVNKNKKLLDTIKIESEDKSFDYLINGWALYQAYVARLIARTGFYQVGGAVGFRDQLQDSLAMLYSDQEFTKKQILMQAAHQFRQGDVLHWWHEDTKFGSRTTFSDDYLWLVYVSYEYLIATKDNKILNEEVAFVDSDELKEFEPEKGVSFTHTNEQETLYNHLKLCIDRATSRKGSRGLPLMGCGDWNDGMNKVGVLGKGESVFVAFFLYDLLNKMQEIALIMGDENYAAFCKKERSILKEAIATHTNDGAWYLRAYYDNGEVLGSRNNQECQIDILSQGWSILSGFAPLKMRNSIYKEVESRLVDKKAKIIKLLTPPFEKIENYPGYIEDYVKGIRENGSQYTHAALWYIKALFEQNKITMANEYYSMINPINKDIDMYKVEPYVLSADVYSNKDNLGRGGWTWYTGSAAWTYKVAIENMIGLKLRGNKLEIDPKYNKDFKVTYKYQDTFYKIEVKTSKAKSITIDGKKAKDNIITLKNDLKEHNISITREASND